VSGDEGRVYRLEDIEYEGPTLDVPSPPPDLPYERFEDWRSAELLTANGIAGDGDALLEALRAQEGILLAAAAHTAGARGLQAAAPLLRHVAEGEDDDAAVEAAYALARLGDSAGESLLRGALDRPVGPYLSPLPAAGYLAQLGDAEGLAAVREGLASDLLAVRMLACTQLAFFLPVAGAEARALLERALADPDPAVRRQARAQVPDT
jgi:HEAT repeat protein